MRVMHGIHQIVTLTQTKPKAAVLFKYAWNFRGYQTLMGD